MARQLTFDLPVRPAQGRGDFFVTHSNAAAMATVEGWRDWPNRKLVLSGPEGSGKTHLALVWAEMTGARLIAAGDLPDTDIPALAGQSVVVEGADRIAGNRPAEEALFHLHNLVLAEGGHLMVTARSAPSRWGLDLPDLRSRMEGTTLTRLDAPDDMLLSAVLVKFFDDRQIIVNHPLITYLARRMDRSLAQAALLVDQLDRAALAEHSPITRAFAARILDKIPETGA
jgi:chromosomal replication initiation ATPase DnaA